MEPRRSLTRREFDEVIRRASELAAAEAEGGDGLLEEAELLRIAGEVGLPERHVKKALAELRSGGGAPSGSLDRVFGPDRVRASRVVPGTPRELSRQIDAFLVGGQLLQAVRRSDRVLHYRPAVDWASQVARAASATSRRYYVAAARSVEIRLEEVDLDHALVLMEVEAGIRGNALSAAAAGALFGGGGAGAGAALLVTGMAPLPMALAAGAAAAGGVILLVARISGAAHRRKLGDVLAEVEGILDRLEAGEPLEPPPPSWRRWVKRHFHGVAKDLLKGEGA